MKIYKVIGLTAAVVLGVSTAVRQRFRAKKLRVGGQGIPDLATSKPEAQHREHNSGLYEALMVYLIHQDTLIWNSTQWLLAVQGAVFIVGYSARDHWLGAVVFLLGAGLAFGLLGMAYISMRFRDANRHLIDELGEQLIPDHIRHSLSAKGYDPPYITLPHHWRRATFLIFRGGYIYGGLVALIILIDLFLFLNCILSLCPLPSL